MSEYSRARVSKPQPTGRIQLVAYLCTHFKLKTVVVLQIFSYIFEGLLKKKRRRKRRRKEGRKERQKDKVKEKEKERKESYPVLPIKPKVFIV